MKLFILHAGDITNPNKASLTPGSGEGIPYRFPVSSYLIDHEDGLVLIDLGYNVDHWPELLRPNADFKEEQRIDRQIQALGYDINDIKYVILSHYHIDHCGCMDLFPNPTYIVRRQEAMFAWWPLDRSKDTATYCFPDYENTRDYEYIEIEEDIDYDVFGDGSLILIDTKGHTRDHQSIVVNLPNSGQIVLAVDAASLKENLDDDIYPGVVTWNIEEGLKSLEKLRKLRDEGAMIIYGHEATQWENLKKAPEFYD